MRPLWPLSWPVKDVWDIGKQEEAAVGRSTQTEAGRLGAHGGKCTYGIPRAGTGGWTGEIPRQVQRALKGPRIGRKSARR